MFDNTIVMINLYFPLSDLLMGSLTLGSAIHAKGSGLAQWVKAISHPMEKIEEWHTMTTNMENMGASL